MERDLQVNTKLSPIPASMERNGIKIASLKLRIKFKCNTRCVIRVMTNNSSAKSFKPRPDLVCALFVPMLVCSLVQVRVSPGARESL